MSASQPEMWQFLPNPGREEEGLGHAGIETFKGSPFPGIARECSQNSLDAAARRPDGSCESVHLVFRLVRVASQEIPGVAALGESIENCLRQADLRGLKKEREFFARAQSIARQERIAVLLVEDYGTTGLIGPAVEGRPFHALVKSSGVSQKADADASGSFGIGKNAAFAVSGLRTVFYSTAYYDDGIPKHLAQGKSILVSHEDHSGHKRATGYWGRPDYMPTEDMGRLPVWLRRASVGTTVASIGFTDEPDWQWLMTESLIRNFFSAINTEAIRFTVQWSDTDRLEIDKATLHALFSRAEVREAAESSGTLEDLEFSAAMLEALRSEPHDTATRHFDDIGTFRLTLLQREKLPRRFGFLRNGMYIADNLRHFGHPMVRFPMSRDFVAVLEPNDRATSGLVRDMESPRHDEISAERLDDPARRRRLKAGMRKVGEWVRGAIKAATTTPSAGEILLDEMNRFFANPGESAPIPDPANCNDDPERPRIDPRPLPPTPLLGSGPQGESGSSGGKQESGTKGGRTSGDRRGAGRGAVGGRGGASVAYSELRNSVSARGYRRRIALTPAESAEAKLEVAAVGVASDEPMKIVSIDGQACSSSPKLTLRKGLRMNVNVEFEAPYSGPIAVVLTALSGGADAP